MLPVCSSYTNLTRNSQSVPPFPIAYIRCLRIHSPLLSYEEHTHITFIYQHHRSYAILIQTNQSHLVTSEITTKKKFKIDRKLLGISKLPIIVFSITFEIAIFHFSHYKTLNSFLKWSNLKKNCFY